MGKNTTLLWTFDGSSKPSRVQWLEGPLSSGTVIAEYQDGLFSAAPGWEDKVSFTGNLIGSRLSLTLSVAAGIIIHDFHPEDAGIYSIKPHDVYAPNQNAGIREYSGNVGYKFVSVSL